MKLNNIARYKNGIGDLKIMAARRSIDQLGPLGCQQCSRPPTMQRASFRTMEEKNLIELRQWIDLYIATLVPVWIYRVNRACSIQLFNVVSC